MKTDTGDVAHRTSAETASPASLFLAFGRHVATGVTVYRKRRLLERNLYLMQRTLGEIPTHLLEDIGLDEWQAAEIVTRITQDSTVPFHPLFRTGK